MTRAPAPRGANHRKPPRPPGSRLTRIGAAALALALGGCASVAIDDNRQQVAAFAQAHTGTPVRWLTSEADRRDATAEVERLLEAPLSGDDAVRIALAYSPALQAVLSDAAAESAQATQSARLPNPVFAFERLLRREGGDTEKEINRSLGVSLLDILVLPMRLKQAELRQQQLRLQGFADVLQAAGRARMAWVQAVAAQQSVSYFEQVQAAAEAGAELARRLQAVGNFSKLQRARQHAFYAEATVELARARHAALAAREALVRQLGLDAAQAARLMLPERLPDLPEAARDERSLAQFALDERLDVRQARARLDETARSIGLTRVTSVVNGLHLAGVRDSETGLDSQRGFDLEFTLPLFDFGDARRAQAQARYMAALHRAAQVAAAAHSQVRERYAAYRGAHELARHYRDEIVPLRKTIADENQLRYNGMLIGVFELLADARVQIASVAQAITAQRDFWLADVALQGALLGADGGDAGLAPSAAAPSAGADGGGGAH